MLRINWSSLIRISLSISNFKYFSLLKDCIWRIHRRIACKISLVKCGSKSSLHKISTINHWLHLLDKIKATSKINSSQTIRAVILVSSLKSHLLNSIISRPSKIDSWANLAITPAAMLQFQTGALPRVIKWHNSNREQTRMSPTTSMLLFLTISIRATSSTTTMTRDLTTGPIRSIIISCLLWGPG